VGSTASLKTPFRQSGFHLPLFRFDPRKRGPSQVEKGLAAHLDGAARSGNLGSAASLITRFRQSGFNPSLFALIAANGAFRR
jgi:hypothetical protein